MENNCEVLPCGTRIYIDKEHRFGTDAMLLSHFARVRRAEKAADLGTGCGIMPLRFFDGGHRGECLAVDIAPKAIALLQMSVAANSSENITPLCADLKEITANISYDVVTCNPPYFTDGLKSESSARRTARFEEACTMHDVCAAAGRLLRDGGRFCVCQRPQRLSDVLFYMKSCKIEPKLLRMVRQRAASAEPWLILVQGQKKRASGMRILPDLIIEDENGEKSAELLEIYNGACVK